MTATALFLASAAFVFYVLLGYPLLIILWSRMRPRPVHKRFQARSVSVLMPVRNGERWLESKLRSLLELDYPKDQLHILVVSDGSTDATDAIAQSFAPQGVELLRVPAGGKALALNAGRKLCHGEILFLTDVRQRLDPRSLRALVECFEDPEVGAVSGELFIAAGQSEAEANTGLYWKYEKLIRKAQSTTGSIPGATGCIYAIRAELAVDLPEHVLADDVYLPMAAYHRGYRLILEPGAKAYDDPTSLNTEFFRKVRTLAGVYQVVGAYPKLLLPTGSLWWHFLSHKFARLMLPWALLVLLISAALLPSPWWIGALVPQLGMYALAAGDPLIPEGNPLKRFTSISRTFVVLMAASAMAASILFRSSKSFWKTSPVATTDRAQ